MMGFLHYSEIDMINGVIHAAEH